MDYNRPLSSHIVTRVAGSCVVFLFALRVAGSCIVFLFALFGMHRLQVGTPMLCLLDLVFFSDNVYMLMPKRMPLRGALLLPTPISVDTHFWK